MNTLRPILADTAGPHDLHKARRDAIEIARRALASAAIPFTQVFDESPTQAVLVVDIDSLDRARVAISGARPSPTWQLDTSSPSSSHLYYACADKEGFLIAGPEQGVRIEGWPLAEQLRRPDDGIYPTGALVAPRPYGYSVPFVGDRGAGADVSTPISAFQSPVDIVYTWVDGSDPTWRERRDRAMNALDRVGHGGAIDPLRFESFDELKYSLRSVFTYAGWFRKIFIVTDSQVPRWLDLSHPRVQIVDHQEILPGSVYNSHAIESRLHHIPGVSEHYIYLNDDVFFGNAVYPEDFFSTESIHHYFPNNFPLDASRSMTADPPIMAAAKNGRDLLEKRFARRVHYKMRHTAHPQQRSLAYALENEFPDDFARVAQSTFRSPSDISVASSLIHWYGHIVGRAIPYTISDYYADLASPQAAQELDALYSLRRYQTLCLNFERSSLLWEKGRFEMSKFLDRYYPHCAPWESP